MAKNSEDKKRATDAELEERVTEVQKYLLNGYTRAYILQMAKKRWNVASRATDEYIHKATEVIREINSVERNDNLATITSNLWEMFRVAKNNNEIESARKILMDIAKLRGLDEQVIQHFVNERPLKDISDEELDETLEGGGDGRH